MPFAATAEGAVARALPELDGLYAAAVPRVLADELTRTIVRALAESARRPSELALLQGVVRSTLFVRLGELTALGIVATRQVSKFPLRVEYRLDRPGRAFLANELLIERQERRKLARIGPGVDAELGTILRLLAPVADLASAHGGRCLLVEREPSGRTHTVWLLVEDRQIAVGDPTVATDPDVRFSATSRAWEDALLEGAASGLEMDGDLMLGHAVMGAFGRVLNA